MYDLYDLLLSKFRSTNCITYKNEIINSNVMYLYIVYNKLSKEI